MAATEVIALRRRRGGRCRGWCHRGEEIALRRRCCRCQGGKVSRRCRSSLRRRCWCQRGEEIRGEGESPISSSTTTSGISQVRAVVGLVPGRTGLHQEARARRATGAARAARSSSIDFDHLRHRRRRRRHRRRHRTAHTARTARTAPRTRRHVRTRQVGDPGAGRKKTD